MLLVSFLIFVAVACVTGFGIVRRLPSSKPAAALHLLGAALFLGGILNFVAYWHLAVHLGGDALGGRVEGGKYFLASHGKQTEVSQATWRYSYAHAKSIPITHPIAGVGLILVCLTDPKRKESSSKT